MSNDVLQFVCLSDVGNGVHIVGLASSCSSKQSITVSAFTNGVFVYNIL